MALLFVGGVMNLYWILGLAIYVYLEKVLAAGSSLGKVVGLPADFLGSRIDRSPIFKFARLAHTG